MTQKKDLRWRIVYGYSPNDYVSISENELEKAKYAMISGKVFTNNGEMIRGNNIQRIERDFRYYTGWFDSYKPIEGDDFLQMKRDMPDEKLFIDREKLSDNRVSYVIQNNKPELLRELEKIDNLLLN